MIVSVNGLILNDSTGPSGFSLDEPIDGLGLPDVRATTGEFSGRDGGYVSSEFYGLRHITMTGYIFGTTAASVETNRQALATAVTGSSITLNITTNAGNQYTTTCYLDPPGLDMPIQRSATRAPFKLTLIAPDPVLYDNSAGGLMTANLARVGGGGLTWPITWPITWASGTPPTTVNNTGVVSVKPFITLNNAMTNPTVTNQTTGQFFSLTGLTTTIGDVVTIDMQNTAVLLNGSPVLSYATLTSTWWTLIPGNNSIALTTSSSGDTVTGTIQWRAGYRGV